MVCVAYMGNKDSQKVLVLIKQKTHDGGNSKQSYNWNLIVNHQNILFPEKSLD